MSAGTDLRDHGFEQLDLTHAIGDDWYERAHRLIEAWPRGFDLDAELVRANCGDPIHPNAMGRLFFAAAESELIEHTGWKSSERRERRGAPIKIWTRL